MDIKDFYTAGGKVKSHKPKNEESTLVKRNNANEVRA